MPEFNCRFAWTLFFNCDLLTCQPKMKCEIILTPISTTTYGALESIQHYRDNATKYRHQQVQGESYSVA